VSKYALTILLLIAAASFLTAQTVEVSNPIVKNSIYNDTSIPLRDMVEVPISNTPWKDGIIPLRKATPKYESKYEKDYSRQLSKGTFSGGNIIENFEGVPNISGVLPPDVSCDVGPNHVMQMVNLKYQIWDKSGNSILGPFNLGTIWAGFPGPWGSALNSGDPVVLYDEDADRWFASQFSLPNGTNGPEYILVAISQTGDPTGSWHRYGFEFADFPDYPHYGVWPDGYYMSANRFGSTIGIYAAAFERDSMLVGVPAQMVSFSRTTATNWSLLPSDWDGSMAPPAGAPNYFVQAHDNVNFGGTDGVDIQEFHVDWITPGNSTFGAPLFLATSPFSEVGDIPQAGSTQLLNSISDRMMQRLQYRNFGSHQSMVVCQTIDAGSDRAGIRWYEFRNTGSGWSIYQEGTYAPADGQERWMGSIAMNGDGDIALGYTASSSSIHPEIRFTGRFDGDPLGLMTIAEGIIYFSGGAQTHSAGRWGDYAQMSIDPVDDQTFWFSHEYIGSTGTANWRTRIASFSFVVPPCTVGTASNPNPANGATDIQLDIPTLSWVNGSDATEIEVIFNFSTIYSGPPVTSVPMPQLSYSTTYLWQVNSTDGNCTTFGPNWSFTTIDNPGSEPVMSLTHTPGNLNLDIFNDASIGHPNVSGPPGIGVTWNGVDGCYLGGVMFGTASTMTVNGMVGSFSLGDIQNFSSDFAGGFTSDQEFDQITEAIVNDGLAPAPFGVEITQKSYSNSGEEFVFIRYGFTNTTGSVMPSAVGGIFIDWDIDANNFATNSGGYTFLDNACYQFGTVTPEYYYGIVSLDGASGMRATTAGSGASIRSESYSFITSLDPTIDPNGDFRSWIGTSLGDIGPGETVWTTFAIVAGSDLAEMTTYATEADAKSASLGWTNLIVPVELTSFTANDNNGEVILNWTTASELNNHMFEIERRSTESQFVTIGIVEGHGTTTELREYTYIDNFSLAGRFFYRLKQIDFSGKYEYSDEIEIEVTGPLTFAIEQNYPNPFNPSTVIKYSIAEDGFVTLDIFNLLGEKIASLVNEIQKAGRYEVNFNAANLASGVYVYNLKSGNFSLVKKMLLIR
jgi:hypothetical protein